MLIVNVLKVKVTRYLYTGFASFSSKVVVSEQPEKNGCPQAVKLASRQ